MPAKMGFLPGCFDLYLPEKIISDARICESGSQKMMHN
jgi:hypothetical protein